MGFLKKIFGKKSQKSANRKPEPVNKTTVKLNIDKSIDPGFKSMHVETLDKNICIGIEEDILQMLHFNTAKDRESYVGRIEALIEKYSLNKLSDVVEFNNNKTKIYQEKDIHPILFYALLKIELHAKKVTTIDGKKEEQLKPVKQLSLEEKVNGPFGTPELHKSIILHNISNGRTDIQEGLNNIMSWYDKDEERKTFRYFNLYSAIAKAYYDVKEYNLSKVYFEKIVDDNLLSDSKKLAKHYKDVGNMFISFDQDYTIKCFEIALKENPNIGVKGKLVKLKTDIKQQ